MEEAEILERVRRRFTGLVAEEALGFHDDAALIPRLSKGHARVVTVDQVHEGVHFLLSCGTASAGWRAIVRNLSDLAAMGAKPVGFVWTLALTSAWLEDDAKLLDGFLQGAARACRRSGLLLLGGDLSRARGAFSCVATLLGDVKGPILTRRGARPGDRIYVSRALGAASAGLSLVKGGVVRSPRRREQQALRAHLWPVPELDLGGRLVGRATSCMDISDGLATDARRLSDASQVALHLDRAAVRAAVHPAAGDREGEGFTRALTGGDDYALLFTLPSRARTPKGCLCIGVVSEGRGVWLDDEDGPRPLALVGYEHFTETRR